MDLQTLNKSIGNIDLYLLDQILKGRFVSTSKVLDAGCGEGRNLTYFLKNQYDVHGIDSNPAAIRMLQYIAATMNPGIPKSNFIEGRVEALPYESETFDLLICSAVLHFAKDHAHFAQMLKEIVRVTKKNGKIFIRMATSIGIEDKIAAAENGWFNLPDGSMRYLIHRSELKTIPVDFGLEYIEPFKIVNVEDARSMSTLVFQKI